MLLVGLIGGLPEMQRDKKRLDDRWGEEKGKSRVIFTSLLLEFGWIRVLVLMDVIYVVL